MSLKVASALMILSLVGKDESVNCRCRVKSVSGGLGTGMSLLGVVGAGLKSVSGGIRAVMSRW